jgi:hypothetical protein
VTEVLRLGHGSGAANRCLQVIHVGTFCVWVASRLVGCCVHTDGLERGHPALIARRLVIAGSFRS